MGTRLDRFTAVLDTPLGVAPRAILAGAALPIVLVFHAPLWTLSFESNQYPEPLRIAIYATHLEGQKTATRDDLLEVNSLNHYIGMRPLAQHDFAEFVWLPLVSGIMAVLMLRAAVLGRVRTLVDLGVAFVYFSLFSAWTFYQRLYDYGHNLAPDAPIKVDPFTPPIFGRVKIANFWVESYPGWGSYAFGVVGLLLLAAAAVTVLALRRKRQPPVPETAPPNEEAA